MAKIEYQGLRDGRFGPPIGVYSADFDLMDALQDRSSRAEIMKEHFDLSCDLNVNLRKISEVPAFPVITYAFGTEEILQIKASAPFDEESFYNGELLVSKNSDSGLYECSFMITGSDRGLWPDRRVEDDVVAVMAHPGRPNYFAGKRNYTVESTLSGFARVDAIRSLRVAETDAKDKVADFLETTGYSRAQLDETRRIAFGLDYVFPTRWGTRTLTPSIPQIEGHRVAYVNLLKEMTKKENLHLEEAMDERGPFWRMFK